MDLRKEVDALIDIEELARQELRIKIVKVMHEFTSEAAAPGSKLYPQCARMLVEELEECLRQAMAQAGIKYDISYYHCGHCTEDISMDIECPVCGLDKDSVSAPKNRLLKRLLGWTILKRLDREKLFHIMREKYDWGYISACTDFEIEIQRLIEELKDDGNGTERN